MYLYKSFLTKKKRIAPLILRRVLFSFVDRKSFICIRKPKFQTAGIFCDNMR